MSEQPIVERDAVDLARVIAGVTDLWDEPLDEVHDIPQIVNAILAAGWTRVTPPVEGDDTRGLDPETRHR